MIKNILIIISIIFFLPGFIYSQSADTTFYSGNYSIKVDSIKITGNKITDNYIILKELTFHEGDEVNSKTLNYNKERIYSLGIFTNVKLVAQKIGNLNYVIIEVNEGWYIYPIPFVTIRDNDWKKLSYGIDLYLQNFRGVNEKIRLRAAFGYDPTYLLAYSNPYIVKNENIFFNANLSYSKVKNKSAIAKILYGGDFDQKVSGGGIQFGKRFGLYQKAFISAGYSVVESPVFIKGISASDTRIDHLLSIGAGYIFDTRDLSQFPRSGTYFLTNFDFKGFNIDNINYQALSFDVRQYLKITNDLSAKARFKTRMTFGSLVPYYDYSFLGFEDRVRGYFFNEREGRTSYLTSVEFNYPLIKDFNLNINFIPLLPKALFSYRIALYAEVFADAGSTRLKNEPISIKKIDSGYGAGLTFLILPYSVFRIEYAINDFGKTQWILGIGTSF